MKLFGYILIAAAVAIVVFVVLYGGMGVGRPDAGPVSDEEFLEAVRSQVQQRIETETEQEAAVEEESSAPIAPVASDFPEPRIEVETHSYDMGMIANDKTTEKTLKVFNRGTAPLEIKRVTTSCGCTKGKMAEDVIRPGKSADLVITVDPFRIPGFTSEKTLTLYTNDPKNAEVQIVVKASVQQELEMDPESLNFGVIDKGAGGEQQVRIRALLDRPFEISEARITAFPNVYESTLEDVPEAEWKTPGRREYIVAVKVLPDAPVGRHTSRLLLTTNLKRLKRAFVSLNAHVKGVYTLEPPFVALRNVKPGEELKGVLKVMSKVPIEIVEFQKSNENLEVTQNKTRDGVSFDVRISDSSEAKLHRDNWILKIRADGVEYTEEVRVVAVVRAEGAAGGRSGLPGDPSEIRQRIEESLKGRTLPGPGAGK